MFRVICLALLGAVVLSFAAAAAPLPSGVKRITATDGITEYRLDNGLKVLLFPDVAKPTVTVSITYLVGSRFENYGETGMAHLLEHMMFKGTPRHPRIDQEFNDRGMQSNASTWLDRTNYYEVFPAGGDNLKWAVAMEADRMVNATIARQDLDSEMTVVRNEFESGENSPSSVMLKRMQGVAYDWHAYGKPTIGNRSDIENVGIPNLRAFYKRYYQPDNAVLLIAGKFAPGQALQWIAHAFGPLPKPTRALPPFWTVEPTQDGERSFTVRRAGDVQIVEVGYKVPGALHPDSDAVSFAAEILGDTPNGRLYRQLVEPGLAAQVFAQDLSGIAPGLQMLGAVVKKDQPIEPVRDALVAAVEHFYKTPPTEEEMARVVRNDSNQIEKTLSDPHELAIALADMIALGDWRLLFENRAHLTKVTAQQVAAASEKYFRRDNRTLGMFLPEDQPQRAEIAPAPTAADVMKDFQPSKESAPAEAFDPNQSNIEARTRLVRIGGLRTALLPKSTRGGTVAVALQLHWGDETSLFGKQTVASLTADMLMRGTAAYTREQLADQMAKLKMSGDVYRFETTRDNLPGALRLTAQILTQPAFAEKEFAQLKNETVVALETSRADPRSLAEQAMAEHFDHYPKGDWRGTLSIDQQIAEIQAATLDQVKQFYQQFYGASHGELAIVGDFDADAAIRVLNDSFADWRSAAAYAPIKHSHAEIAPMQRKIDTPDKENGFYTARLDLDLGDDDPGYPALSLANYIFGGGAGLDSRLMERIRKKDGLSYGGESSLDPGMLDRDGSFTIDAIAAPQNLARVDADVRQELQRIRRSGFTAEEVARAKSGMLQQRVQTRSQDNALASGWVTYLYLDRTFAWSKQYEDKIRALTVEQVNAAWRKAIDADKLSVVIAGDSNKYNPRTK